MKVTKIVLTKNAACEPFNRAENVGDVFEVESELATKMIDASIAKLATETDSQLPPDIPARETLVKLNINSIEELKAIDNLTDLEGIAAKTAAKINEYLAK